MRFFNTAGPTICKDHYCLPPLERFDLWDEKIFMHEEEYPGKKIKVWGM